MSDLKDLKDLKHEEKALWDALAITARRNGRVAAECYSATEGAFRDLLKARRALFGEPASEGWGTEFWKCRSCGSVSDCPYCDTCGVQDAERFPEPASEGGKVEKFLPCGCVRCTCEDEIQCHGCGAKMCELHRLHREPASEGVKVCPNCRQPGNHTEHTNERGFEWTCKPAQPEPVAAEMPEALRRAINWLRFDPPRGGNVGSCHADALESFWRAHAAQPANTEKIRQDGFDDGYLAGRTYERTFAHPAPAVAMTEELEVVLRLAAQHVEGWQQTYQSPEYREQMLSAIAAVRAQAAEAGKVTLPKVNEALWLLRKRAMEKKDLEVIKEAQREVNAAEGRK